MPNEKSRSKAMAIAARIPGVISVGITGDGKDMLEVVGVSVDPVSLVCCLRNKKLGHAQIVKVEEVKDKEEKKKPEYQPLYYCYPAYPPAPHLVPYDEPPTGCAIM
ncbi:hypothetical protein BRADI_5g12960v3 [Brachypodium distachyon]|nr:hypothetical protein BRADI_5g12960v3 [Brachypodium distachyon]